MLASFGSWRLSPGAASSPGDTPPQQAPQRQQDCNMAALLLWHSPRHTARVAAGGLYLVICMQQLACGYLPLQPISVACGALLVGILVYMYRHGSRVPSYPSTTQATIEDALRRASRALAPVLASIVDTTTACITRSKGATAVLVGSLWFLLCVSELRVASQWTLMCCAWLMLFTVPFAYSHMRDVVDAAVDRWWAAGHHAATSPASLSSRDLRRVGGSAGAAVVVFALLYDLSFVTRVSLAAVVFFIVARW